MFRRAIFPILCDRLAEPRRFMQVLVGPRQTGKTTLARQIMEALALPCHYASADEPALKDRMWIEQQWEVARLRVRSSRPPHTSLLILDEIQKLVVIEVKSQRRKTSLPGLGAFGKAFPATRNLLVGAQGMSWHEFLLTPPVEWVT